MKDIFAQDESKYTYNVDLNYGSANPFKKLFYFGSGSISVGAIISNIAFRIGIRAVTQFTVMGATIVSGISGVIGGIGILIFLPGIIGIGIYELYRIYKNKNVKELYNGLKDSNNAEYDLERELYYKTL